MKFPEALNRRIRAHEARERGVIDPAVHVNEPERVQMLLLGEPFSVLWTLRRLGE